MTDSKSSSSSYSRGEKYKSYGIICFRIPPNRTTIDYLMVARKYSIGFVLVILGKYKRTNIRLMRKLVGDMTTQEKKYLLTESFETLATRFFGQYDTTMESAKEKFLFVKRGFKAPSLKETKTPYLSSFDFYNQQQYLDLETSQEYVPSWKRGESVEQWTTYTRPSRSKHEWISWSTMCQKVRGYTPILAWGFPKGKRGMTESPLQAAIREFKEETNLGPDAYTVLKAYLPIWEIFTGMNDKTYKYTYYIAKAETYDTPVFMVPENPIQTQEISNIQWLPYKVASNMIRPQDPAKARVLTRLHSELCRKYAIVKTDET